MFLRLFVHQAESGQGDLGTLANVVTSLANLNDSLSNGETTDDQMEESPSEITRCVNNADNTCVPVYTVKRYEIMVFIVYKRES